MIRTYDFCHLILANHYSQFLASLSSVCNIYIYMYCIYIYIYVSICIYANLCMYIYIYSRMFADVLSI